MDNLKVSDRDIRSGAFAAISLGVLAALRHRYKEAQKPRSDRYPKGYLCFHHPNEEPCKEQQEDFTADIDYLRRIILTIPKDTWIAPKHHTLISSRQGLQLVRAYSFPLRRLASNPIVSLSGAPTIGSCKMHCGRYRASFAAFAPGICLPTASVNTSDEFHHWYDTSLCYGFASSTRRRADRLQTHWFRRFAVICENAYKSTFWTQTN